MKKLLLALIVLLFSISANAITFHGVYYQDGINAFAVTDNGYWLKSDDGGMNWNGYKLPILGYSYQYMFDTYMLDENRGWTVGYIARVLYTDDSGWDWTQQDLGQAILAFRIEMYNEQIGWISCDAGGMLFTTDGGNYWERLDVKCNGIYYFYDFQGLSVLDTTTCWICGGISYGEPNKGYLFCTVDTGNNWQFVLEDSSYQLRDIHFPDATHGYSIGGEDSTYQAIIYKTSDGGQNWTRDIFPDEVKMLTGLSFACEDKAWACGYNGTIIHTEDAWETYELQESGTDSFISDIDFADSLHGVAGGHDALLVTTDGGETWENRMDYVNYSPNSFLLYDPFYGEPIDWNTIQFEWFKATDFDSDGSITYNFYFSDSESFENIIASAEGLTDTTITFENLPLESSTYYYWRVKAFDSMGLGTWCSHPNMFYTLELGIEDKNLTETPSKTQLKQNYPNPFNPSTFISFELPEKSQINLKIYDTSGKLVKILETGYFDAGYHRVIWNGKDENGNHLPSGIYFYQLDTNGKLIDTKGMVLLR